MKLASTSLPHNKHTVTPYIIVKGAAQFIDFLKQAFDAHEFGRAGNPDGSIGHAEVQVGDSTLMIADGRQEWHDTPCFLSIYVDDADDVFEQALKAGHAENAGNVCATDGQAFPVVSTTLFPGSLTRIPRKGMSYGMSPRRVRQINSARTAVKLLPQGKMLSGMADELEDADSKVKATRPGIHTAEA